MQRSRVATAACCTVTGTQHLVVVGGGAGGIYASIEAARHSLELSAGDGRALRVTVLEKNREALRSVLASGGGRCNVTTGLFSKENASSMVEQFYPRGYRELRWGFFQAHCPIDVMSFFESRGVPLKTERDGRVFPRSDSAASISNALLSEARRNDVDIVQSSTVKSLSKSANGTFKVKVTGNSSFSDIDADFVLLATGGSNTGYRMASSLGHEVLPGVPSLFSFRVDAADDLIQLAGVSIASCDAKLVVPPVAGGGADEFTLIKQKGFPLLVTHRGISGPLILRMSSWGARALHDANYVAALELDTVPEMSGVELQEYLVRTKEQNKRKFMASFAPRELKIPKRFWAHVLKRAAGITGESTRWAEVSNKNHVRSISNLLKAYRLKVIGRGPPGDEFVTAGGVALREIDLKTMESKVAPGLYFAGEVTDVDGVRRPVHLCWGARDRAPKPACIAFWVAIRPLLLEVLFGGFLEPNGSSELLQFSRPYVRGV